MIDSGTNTLVVGISGASSSGKTTLSRLLRDIFPNTFILHEDDFFKEDKNLAFKHGLKDGDCAEALMIPEMAAALSYIKTHGSFPPDFASTKDLTAISESESLIPASTIAALKAKVEQWTSETEAGKNLCRNSSLKDPSSDSGPALKICILDGFLLYAESMSAIHQYMDLKFFLPVSYGASKARREARAPYVLKDGSVWTEPPGYFDKIVWPNYVEEHGWMFEDGDVGGRVKRDAVREKEIEVLSERTNGDMETTVKWAVECLIRSLTSWVAE